MYKNDDLCKKYLDYLNENIFPNIKYDCLLASYKTDDMEYAKKILKLLHHSLCEIYGTSHIDKGKDAIIPAVIMSNDGKNICLALIHIYLSPVERYDTIFFGASGILPQNQVFLNSSPENESNKGFLTSYIPYSYWYTVTVEGDTAIDFSNIPEKVRKLLDECS